MKNPRWAHGPGLAIGVAALLAAARSVAAPAVVLRANVEVRSAPNSVAQVVAHLDQNAAVTADDRAVHGWRGVTLSSGVSGFVLDGALRIEVPAPAPPAPAPDATPDSSRDVVPARVNVFELTARAAPNTAAPVLHVFTNGALLIVSPTEQDGWRRTRLPDGQTAYVANAGLAFGASPQDSASAPSGAPAPVQPLGVAPAAPPRAKIYLSDTKSLALLVSNDPVVSPMAQHLVMRRQAAIATGIVVALVGGGVIAAGFLDSHQECSAPSVAGGQPQCYGRPNFKVVAAGVVIFPVAGLLAALVAPKRSDLLDVVNAWNPRHLDNQLTIDPATGVTNN